MAFTQKHFDALAKLNVLHDNKYFTLVHQGIRFSQYVGVVQIDTLSIEILPKADQLSEDTSVWRNALISMLQSTKKLKVNQVGQANVSKQNIHLLDIYFDWFLREVDTLIRQGLIRKYYKETKNVTALKGKLEFAGHISKNLIHKERFYTTHQIYDKDHQIHQILNLALSIIEQLTKGSYLFARCKSVQLNFPEVSEIKCTATTFEKIRLNRKAIPYEKALEIARLIILNYAPNISSGAERMLALMFDMNRLWEEFILRQMQRDLSKEGWKVSAQRSEKFWEGKTIRPDIVLTRDAETYIIDTKWKLPDKAKPSDDDLKQMYVYNHHWTSVKSLLLYPRSENQTDVGGAFYLPMNGEKHFCKMGYVDVLRDGVLNRGVGEEVLRKFD